MSSLNAALVLVTWPQLLVGGGGIAFVVVGVISGVVLFPHIQWREPVAVSVYVLVMSLAAIAGGACFIVAGVFRSHFWELTGAIVLVAGYAVRMMLARSLRRHHSDED
jgi:hypothetical protein